MRTPIPRHNVNLTGEEVRFLLGVLAGQPVPPRARERFELKLGAAVTGHRAVAVESGRSALALVLRALALVPGERVVLPAYGFHALVSVVEGLGLEPVFAPVDPGTFALDPARLEPFLEDAGAVVVIHPFGQLAPMKDLLAVCEGAGVPLIEDASQSMGAGDGKRIAGGSGVAGVFSLVDGKNVQTFGGGAVVSRSSVLLDQVRDLVAEPVPAQRRDLARGLARAGLATRTGYALGVWGASVALSTVAPGVWHGLFEEAPRPFDAERPILALDDARCHLGTLELDQLRERNRRRRANGLRLVEALERVPRLHTQAFDRGADNAFNAVAVRVPDARGLAAVLLREGVDARQDYMSWFGEERSFHEPVLYLPNHPAMTFADVDRVADAVRRCLERPT